MITEKREQKDKFEQTRLSVRLFGTREDTIRERVVLTVVLGPCARRVAEVHPPGTEANALVPEKVRNIEFFQRKDVGRVFRAVRSKTVQATDRHSHSRLLNGVHGNRRAARFVSTTLCRLLVSLAGSLRLLVRKMW
ncbi:hypothetical protein MRX96_042334 [Rhipicephalus microplus]